MVEYANRAFHMRYQTRSLIVQAKRKKNSENGSQAEEKKLAEPISSDSDISSVKNDESGMGESSDEDFLRHLPLYRPLLHVTKLI